MKKNELECNSKTFLDPLFTEQLSQKLLFMAKHQGATSAEVAVSLDKGLSVTTRLGEVETVEFNQDKSFALTVYFGQRRGSVTSTDHSEEALAMLVKKACDIASVGDEDPCFGLAEAGLLATEFPDLQLHYPWQIEAGEAIDLAKECEKYALGLDPNIVNSDGCTVASYQFLRTYANSHGFMASTQSSRHSKSCVLLGKDKQGLKRGYDYTIARDPHELMQNKQLAESTVQRTLSLLDAQKLSTRTCPVIFSSEVSSSLLNTLVSAISGGSIYRRASFLVDKLGERIFPARYSIYEKPYLVGGLGSSAYDAEGVQTRNNVFLESGVLKQYVLGSYSARRLGKATTANAGGVHNLTINNDNVSFDELLKEMDTGLLVTSLMGSAVSLMTGNYSRGASGFWVEGGKIQFPVEEVTVAGNLLEMFNNIQLIASDEDKRKSTHCGSLLIKTMTVAGS